MKKGFTLIELLAVIIILAVVSIIATPMVLDVLNDSKLSVNKSTAYNILDAANLYYSESLFDKNKSNKINNLGNIYGDITVSGSKPDNGSLYVNNNGNTALSIILDGKCYKKEFVGDLTVTNDETCSLGYIGNDSIKPTIALKEPSEIDKINSNGWAKENFYAEVNVSDEDSGPFGYKWCVSNTECDPIDLVENGTGSVYVREERENIVCVIGYDLAGNDSGKLCKIYRLDKTKPEFSGISDVTINKDEAIDLSNGVSASDSLSGLNGTYSYNPTTVDTSIAGTTNVTYSISDLAGNTNSITRKIIVDAEAPRVVFSNDYGWHKDNFYAPVTLIDNSGLGFQEAKWCITQENTCTPVAIKGLEDINPQVTVESNNNRICVYLKDNNNKENTMCSDAYKLDKTAPIAGTFNISGTLGSNGWYTSDVTISAIAGSDSLSGHNNSSVNISSITSNTTDTAVTLTTTDVAGNSSSRTTTIKMDKNAPVLANWWWGEVTKDVARLYIQASDISGISNVQCPTSTATGSYNNWYWFNAIWDSGANAYRCDITPSTFGHYSQTYATHLYMYDNASNGGYINATSINIPSNEYIDDSGANKPELFANMIPVIYNGSNWVYADKTATWYDYNNKQWANAVVLNSGVTKTIGSTIDESEIALWFVWIPRYKYTIFNGNNGSIAAQQIDVTFENGTASTGTVTCNDNIGTQSISETCSTIINGTSTYTHPAFCLGNRTNGVCSGTELTGIWVGKFENSASNAMGYSVQTILIKPNIISWRSAQVATFFKSIEKIKNDYIINADSHMMKNMEWGAVAYLTQSKYGRCTNGICEEVSKNDSSSYYTGKSQGTTTPTWNSTSNGTYSYNTPNGQMSSTTKNIYGVYDMSGGADEYVMGNIAFSSTSPIVGYNSDDTSNFSGKYYDGTVTNGGYSFPDYKYTNMYSYDSSVGTTHSRGKLGDATKETLAIYGDFNGGWNGDTSGFPNSANAWFVRGGRFDNISTVGVFYYFTGIGNARNNSASRSVLSAG